MNIQYWFWRLERELTYGHYQRKYHFGMWHMMPKKSKPYVEDIINYIVESNLEPEKEMHIVEIGCGLCDILADKRLGHMKRTGIDIERNVIEACKEIYRKTNITFIEGSFDVVKDMQIDVLIAVNFIHNLSREEMQKNIGRMIAENDIRTFILDEVDGDGYKYHHDFSEIVPDGYEEKNCFGPYPIVGGGKRYTNVFEKTKE